jgi:hypothetical protein
MTPGLLLTTRRRSVWTRADQRAMDRAHQIVKAHGDTLKLACGTTTCPDPRLQIVEDDRAAGGRVLQCGCTRRIFARGL